MAQPAVTKGAWAVPQHPSPEDVDWELIDRLWSDQTLVDLGDIATMCGMANRQSAWLWRRASLNYLLRHYRQWPPSPQALRVEVHGEPDGHPPARYFDHPSILPPPDYSGNGKRGQARWFKGTIYRWGMNTHRISMFTGEPNPPVVGAAPGRGPVKGRAPLRGGKPA